ncbi:hypothetical protein RMATCC62417_11797 [Rhizopus microsporus]|nr:hypothetical protein RMATCC62417_11797 [Rhizopus microsporus]
MSIPVPFSDIGKPSKDLLSKDYPIDGVKVEVKTTASDGMTFKVAGHRDSKTGIMVADMETKYVDKKNGVVITEGWTSSNHLNSKVELDNNLTKGLKLELLTSYVPVVDIKIAKLNAIYKKPTLHTVASVDLFKRSFNVNSVVGRQGLVAGAEVAYNAKEARISNYSAAVGYSQNSYSVALLASNNLSRYAASYYHRINSNLEASGKAEWNSMTNVLGLEFGGKLVLDSTASVKGKITNNGIVGVAYMQTIRPGVKLNLGAAVDATRLNESAHKIGLSLSFEN